MYFKKLFQKTALLSPAFIVGSAFIISPILPIMKNEYSNVSPFIIELLVTLPALSQMIVVLFSKKLVGFFEKKKVIICGLFITGIFGMFPFFSLNLVAVIISRLFLGIGLGLYSSVSITLISDNFSGDECAKLIGYQTTITALGTAILMLLSQNLANLSLKYAFIPYAIAFIVILIFECFKPKKIDIQVNTTTKSETSISSIPRKKFITLLVIFFIFYVLLSGVMVKAPSLIINNKLGAVGQIATIMSFNTLVSLCIGASFGKIYKLLKEYTLLLVLFLGLFSMISLTIASNLLIVILGMLLTAIASAILIPYLYTMATILAPPGKVDDYTASIVSLSGLGLFISPVAYQFIGLLSQSSKIERQFRIVSLIFIGIILLELLKIKMSKRISSGN